MRTLEMMGYSHCELDSDIGLKQGRVDGGGFRVEQGCSGWGVGGVP